MTKSCLAAICILFCLTDGSAAQRRAATLVAPPRVTGAATAVKPDEPPTPGVVPPQEAGAPTEVNQRLQMLQTLQYDRRPSSILKAWSTPPKPDEPAEEPKPPEEGADLDPAAAAAAAEAAKLAAEAAKTAKELAAFQRQVTLGDWTAVKDYLAGLPAEEAKPAYQQLLRSLGSMPAPARPTPNASSRGAPPNMQQLMERNVFSMDDIIGLTAAVPYELDKEAISGLGAIVRLAIQDGLIVEEFVVRLRTIVEQTDGSLNQRQVAQLLFAAGQSLPGGEFLPSLAEALEQDDREGLNLLSRYFLAMHAKEKKTEYLEQAWKVTQAVLASGDVEEDEKSQALRRAVELSSRISEELGHTWLEESFTGRPQRGMEIIATIGGQAATGLQSSPTNPDFRLKGLELQKTAVEALLESAPDLADQWQQSLSLLAGNWLREAVFAYQNAAYTSMGPQLVRDMYGNFYYTTDDPYANMRRQPNAARPISPGDLLELRPSQQWLSLIEGGLRPKFTMIFAQLYLRGSEEEEAFPYIENLAQSHPEHAHSLAEEFLQVWTRNHDPNSRQRRTNPYMYIYGFERKAESIPLTRSKQERNLQDLSEWVQRLRSLPIKELDEKLLARAFTTSHSSAEVYRLEAIEKVFGQIDGLKPKTLAELIQRMRANLVGVWRQPAVQQANQTKRKQKDIEAEVLRGYQVARTVVDDALMTHPDEWTLQLARAAVLHDEVIYQQELTRSSEFSKNRETALGEFQKAAQMYADLVGQLSEDEETTEVYELWFYASLGACDLNAIDQEKQSVPTQIPQIQKAILALPGEAAERHMAAFANSLFTRMSSVNPAIKVRYLRGGFQIVGDHKRAHEARKVFDYYTDLVTEIKLDVVVDGRDIVGHEEPFGVFVNIRHTREIERESGGFSRYLQNQNNLRYAYNYGRPTENYRDKFEEAARQALQEHFEVMSVTFNSEEAGSKAIADYGWRITPYAYILLKPRGPQVDRIPPLQLDLDFLDTSGYAIIPIESAAVPIDASQSNVDPRPFENLQITQTLDERQADEGKLILEVKATALGVIPSLDDLLDLKPSEFDIAEIDDQGVAVSRFDQEGDETAVISERIWNITMRSKSGLDRQPTSFRFGSAKVDVNQVTFQRYVDADLESVDQEISLEERYGHKSYAWIIWISAGGLLLLGGVALLLVWRSHTRRGPMASDFRIPDRINPFTVLGLLQEIQRNNGLDEQQHGELRQSINRLEAFYFDKDQGQEPDLRRLAEDWVKIATQDNGH